MRIELGGWAGVCVCVWVQNPPWEWSDGQEEKTLYHLTLHTAHMGFM